MPNVAVRAAIKVPFVPLRSTPSLSAADLAFPKSMLCERTMRQGSQLKLVIGPTVNDFTVKIIEQANK
jgi:hypothetical protein